MEEVTLEKKCLELANSFYKKGLSIPAIFFLELYKPLAGLTGLGLEALTPLLTLAIPKEKFEDWQAVFESRERVESIIQEIERLNKK